MNDINNFERRITTQFSKFGRRFMVGDIIIRSCGEMLHLYVNDNHDGIDSIKNHDANFKPEEIETILDNSEDI